MENAEKALGEIKSLKGSRKLGRMRMPYFPLNLVLIH